jgi:predicted RND superfamily exporter protein
MKKFYKQVVNHPNLILTVFAVLFVICAICKTMISVDYDMNDYLPEDSASTVALDLMDEEFGSGIPNARVMVENVTIPQALQYKADMEAIDGVTVVTWLDDVVSVEIPLEIMDTDTVENYYVDGNALFSVTIDSEKRIDAVNALRDLIGDDNAMTGSAVSTATATQSTVKEISKIAVIAVLFVILVLAVTTTSWMEPIIIMIGLGLAVIINAGSNLIFGEISFVTNAAGNILQLAVSLDYSVFLLHRFTECRKSNSNPKEAMVQALTMSTSSILSSGLTTVIGFLALCLMQFQIGPDLGRALAKGIAISLITVFVFMPALILKTYKWIDQFEHRPFLPSFRNFGKVVQKMMIPMVIVFAMVVVPANLASNYNSFYYGASKIFGPSTKLGADTEKIEEIFGKSDNYVLMVPKGDKETQKELSDTLHEIPQVSSIISYVDTVGTEIPESYLDAATLSKLNSENYTRMVISVDAEFEGEETFELVEKVRDTAQEFYPDDWYLAGEGVSTYDLMDTITADMVKVNLVAIGAVFLVLLLTLHSAVLPIILVLSIETAIWINLAIPYFADSTIFYIAYLIISSIQLGATVDYAILFTERYKECRETMDKKDAIVNTISAVTSSILTSGSVLTVVGFLLGAISTHGLLSQLGYFLGKGTLCSLVIVLFVLPGFLYLFDHFFVKQKGKEKQKRKLGKKKATVKVIDTNQIQEVENHE